MGKVCPRKQQIRMSLAFVASFGGGSRRYRPDGLTPSAHAGRALIRDLAICVSRRCPRPSLGHYLEVDVVVKRPFSEGTSGLTTSFHLFIKTWFLE